MNVYNENSDFNFVKRRGFTLAEVLITLVVIGVISVLVIPSAVQNTKDKQYDAARQKVLATIGQAGRTMAINGTINYASDAKDFVNNYFSKYVKIAKTCENNNLEECGLPAEITTMDGDLIEMPKKLNDLSSSDSQGVMCTSSSTNSNGITILGKCYNLLPSYGFTLINGYAINLFYFPGCQNDYKGTMDRTGHSFVCLNAVYDMNGLKKPNKVGKDIGFLTVFYPNYESTAVAPKPYHENLPDGKNYSFTRAQSDCSDLDLFLPTREELLSILINSKLMGMDLFNYWSSSQYSADKAWAINFNYGYRTLRNKTDLHRVRCVYK